MDPISSQNSVDQIQQKPLLANQISTHENVTSCSTIDNHFNENPTHDSDNQVIESTTRMPQQNTTDADIPGERDANNHSVDDNKSSSEQPIDNSIANPSSYNPPRFDIVMIGNSNVRSINTILPNTTCKVIELRQKSCGATKLSRNLKVCSKILTHQVGHGEMMKNTNDKIANDSANLIDITVEVQQISPDDIIICGIMHRHDQKVHTTNNLLSSVCIRKGCKFLLPDFKRHHYRDNVHLDSSGMELWFSQIAIHCSQILGVSTN